MQRHVLCSRAAWLAAVLVPLVALPASADLRVFEVHPPGEAPPVPASPPAEPEAPPVPATPPAEPVPAETVPAETAPAETAPAETAPAETVPAETVPAETVPAETVTTSLEPGATAAEPAAEAATSAGPAAVPPAHERQPFVDDHRWLDLTGFLQPGFIVRLDDESEPISAGITDDSFWLQRARFGLRAQLFDWMRMRLELEMTPTPLLVDAFLDLAPHPAFVVRVGQFIVPFLQTYRFNELNLAFLDRAIYVPNRPDRDFIRDLAPRDVGLSISGRIGDLELEAHSPVLAYDLAMMIGRGPNIALNDDNVFLWAGRLQFFPLGLPQGVDHENDLARNDFPRPAVGFGAYSNCDDRENWNRGFTVDLEARWEGLFLEGAFVWLRRGARDGNFLANTDGCAGQPDGSGGTYEFVSRGAHLQLQYVIPRLFMDAGLDVFSSMEFELLFRADYVDGNSPFVASDPLFGGGTESPGYAAPSNFTDSDNPPSRWRLTFGLNFYPTGQNQLRLGINYQLNREYEDVMTGAGVVRGVSNDVFWLQITAGI